MPSFSRQTDPVDDRKKMPPPAETNAEIYYYKKQIDSHTMMVVVLQDGEEIEGTIEWYDRDALKINRKDEPNILLLKHNIKYMFKAEDTQSNQQLNVRLSITGENFLRKKISPKIHPIIKSAARRHHDGRCRRHRRGNYLKSALGRGNQKKSAGRSLSATRNFCSERRKDLGLFSDFAVVKKGEKIPDTFDKPVIYDLANLHEAVIAGEESAVTGRAAAEYIETAIGLWQRKRDRRDCHRAD